MEEIQTKYGQYLLPALCLVTGILIGFLLSPVKSGRVALFSGNTLGSHNSGNTTTSNNSRRRIAGDRVIFGMKNSEQSEEK